MSAYFRLRQICLVTRDMTRSVADFTEIFGVRLAYRDPMVARYGLENALFPFGLAFVEIVAPTRADTTLYEPTLSGTIPEVVPTWRAGCTAWSDG